MYVPLKHLNQFTAGQAGFDSRHRFTHHPPEFRGYCLLPPALMSYCRRSRFESTEVLS